MQKGFVRRLVIKAVPMLLAFLLVFSLLSYHPNDPTLLSRGGVGNGYNNWCGFVGANLAGLPIAFVGLGTWLLPVYIVWDTLSRELRRWHRRVAWFVLLLAVWTFFGAFGAVNWPPTGNGVTEQIHYGGWVGYVLWPALKKIFGPVGLPLTLLVLIVLSLSIIMPKLARRTGGHIARWFENRAWPWLKPKVTKCFQSFIGMAKRPILALKPKKQVIVPELDANDGIGLVALNEHQQAVKDLERAQREATIYKQSSFQSNQGAGGYSGIHPVNINANTNPGDSLPQIVSAVVPTLPPDLQDSGVVLTGPASMPLEKPIPPHLLRGLPSPPVPKPQLVKPRLVQDSFGRIVEQPPLGLLEPTPNKPISDIPAHIDDSNAKSLDRKDLPPRSLFDPPTERVRLDPQTLEETKALIQQKLSEFKVKGHISGMQPGPVVTVYEFSPDPGVPLAKIMSMEEDLALGLKAEGVRIDRIHGKNVVGIEVPNVAREIINFREILDSQEFLQISRKGSGSMLPLVLGKDIARHPVVADLAKMPHLLIGGCTGCGKSVGINAMICSILLSARADEVKLILVDPKMVELGVYEDIPHLWAPVVTDMKEAGRVLKWVVAQMEERYRQLSILSVRNLEQFNSKVIESGGVISLSDRTPNPKWPERPTQLEPLPYVVVVIDELADLMMVCRSEVEDSIARIAQKARAVGIHLVLATQRPSVDIVTGVIKANLPARLSYQVLTKIDSRTILDSGGGEQLLGKGDALFLAPGTNRPRRIHAPFLTEVETLRIIEWLKERGRPDYNQALIQAMDSEEGGADFMGGEGAGEDIYGRAVAVVKRERKASTSLLQRKLSIGYSRAARIIDRMEQEGLIGPDLGAGKPRKVFVDADFGD
ncbi:MAG: DNA translocase FtsK 4TM domain-containing protein [Holophagaceae bacterium]|nr:DNA translocase FtsK 4TM domain-containing protein [Holophagaceae bacterium]